MFSMSPLQGQGHVQGCPWGGGWAGLTAHKGLLLLKQLRVICCTCHLPDHTAMGQSIHQVMFPCNMCCCICQSTCACACASSHVHVLLQMCLCMCQSTCVCLFKCASPYVHVPLQTCMCMCQFASASPHMHMLSSVLMCRGSVCQEHALCFCSDVGPAYGYCR